MTRLPVAEQIRKGLEEAIRHARGEITLKSTVVELPDPPPEIEAGQVTSLRLESRMSQAVFARRAQCLDQDGAELGARHPKAISSGASSDPGVWSKPGRGSQGRRHGREWPQGDFQREDTFNPREAIGRALVGLPARSWRIKQVLRPSAL